MQYSALTKKNKKKESIFPSYRIALIEYLLVYAKYISLKQEEGALILFIIFKKEMFLE